MKNTIHLVARSLTLANRARLWPRIVNLACLTVGLILVGASTASAQPLKNGTETLVNTNQTNHQQNPDIAADSNGNYVVVWESFEEDGDDYGIYAQRYNPDGSKNGTAFLINTTQTNLSQRYPAVSMSPGGAFVVVWQSFNTVAWEIRYQIYNSGGNPAGGNSTAAVGTSTTHQSRPDVAMEGNGDFVIVWQSGSFADLDIQARRFNASGGLLSSILAVNTTTSGFQMYPAIGSDTTGNTVIVWQSEDQDLDGHGIFGQRISSAGSLLGGEFAINADSIGSQTEPAVAMNASGAFAVTWSSYGQDGDKKGIYAQRFQNDGSKSGGEFLVNTTTAGDQGQAALAIDGSGNLAVVWNSYGQDGDREGVYGKTYDNSGAMVHDEFAINTTTAGFQQFPAVYLLDNAAFGVAWQDGARSSNSSVDGSGYGVVQQLYAGPVSILLPADTLINCGEDTSPANTGMASMAGNCGPVQVNFSDSLTTFCANTQIILRSWTLTDSCGSTVNGIQTITVQDTLPPVAPTPPADTTVDCAGDVPLATALSATDACHTNPIPGVVSDSVTAGSGPNSFSILRTWTFTDSCSNSSLTSQTITVSDTEVPVLNCPGTVIVSMLAGICSGTVPDLSAIATATDNCGTIQFFQSPATGVAWGSAHGDQLVVSVVVHDGDTTNSVYCSVTLSLVDDQTPAISCPGPQNVLSDPGSCQGTVPDLTALATAGDNCGTAIVTQLPTAGTKFGSAAGDQDTVILYVNDGNGNIDSCEVVLTLIDNGGCSGVAAPTNLAISYSTQFMFDLSWDDNANNELGFLLEQKIGAGSFLQIETLVTDTESLTDTVVQFGVPISYRVRAFNGSDTSAYSNIATETQPSVILPLDLLSICRDYSANELLWWVVNPNGIAIPAIWAQYWSPARDTLNFPPGTSSFRTTYNPQSNFTFGNDNITGVWWIGQNLMTASDVVFEPRNRACSSTKLPIVPEAGQIPGVFTGALQPYIDANPQGQLEEPKPELTHYRIYPNPTEELLFIEAENASGPARLELLNGMGQVLIERDIMLEEKSQIDLSPYPAGVYLIRIESENGSHIDQVIRN